MKKTLLPLLLAALILAHGTASGWGFFGHRTITQLAVYELPATMQAFYFRHMTDIVRLSTAPDERRNDDPTEASKHYIDMDHYSETDPFGKVPRQYDEAVAKFSADTLKKYGTVPWVILETKNNLTEAFRLRDTMNIVKYSAELSHYVGDAFVPLHTTINYDGQLTDQKGLHDLWESQLPEKYIVSYNLTGEPAKYVKDPLAAVWAALAQSYGFLGETFDQASKIEKVMKPGVRFTFSHRYGKTTRHYSDAFAAEYEKAVGGMVDYRLKGAPVLVSSLWLTAWQDAGKPDLNGMMTPKKLNKEESEKLNAELVAWKKNTLAQDQLLLAQQKLGKIEAVDQLKSAKDMTEAPAEADEAEPEAAEAPEAPEAAPAAGPATVPAVAPSPTPTTDKLKLKTKGTEGTEKVKQKSGGAK